MSKQELNRRAFLRNSGALTVAGMATPWFINLSMMAEAAAASAAPGDDYKALVCVFLQGGNDHANTLIPFDPVSHEAYAKARGLRETGGLAIPLAELTATQLAPTLDRTMALAPALAPLKPLFDNQRMAVLLNIGPVVRPTSLDDFKAGKGALPPKLFSHNDQQSVWLSSMPEGSVLGWGGVIGEDQLPALPDSGKRPPRDYLTNVNLASNNVFLAGQSAGQYMVNANGIAPLKALSGAHFGSSSKFAAAFKTLVTTENPLAHRMAKEHANIMRRAIDTNEVLLGAMSGLQIKPLSTADANAKPLAAQLNMVARLIEANQQLGLKRQVFYVALGGFDNHDRLTADHPRLLAQLAQALSQFDKDLDTLNMADKVTTFTASDFGRTMSSNGDGSDHGWGSYHFVMGGAVNGGRYYGDLPAVTGGATDIGQGRLLPTMAVDQLSVALAGWMGVAPSRFDLLAPNWQKFSATTLSGLLKK